MSLIEAWVGTLIGLIIAYFANYGIMLALGAHIARPESCGHRVYDRHQCCAQLLRAQVVQLYGEEV